MRKPLYLILCIAIIASACQILKRVNTFNLEIGMTKSEASHALQKKPDNIVGAKQYDDGVLEVVQFSGPAAATSEDHMERYWLYFFNNRLVEWGQPLDWQLETERVYRMRKKAFGRH